MSIQDWSRNDIIIDINKGYVLQRLGAYSPNLAEEVIHTFIPLSKFCIASPKTDVCQYASTPVDTNIALLNTVVSSRNIIRSLSSYNQESVSKVTEQAVIRVLSEHHPDNVIRNTKAVVHFVNKQFYYDRSAANSFQKTSPTNTIENYLAISPVRSNSVEKFLKQISIRKIGLEFLSNKDMKVFLVAAYSTIDRDYIVSNAQESLNTFSQYVIGQSVFALRYCSLTQHNSLPSEPCIVVSTLFLRIQLDASSTFFVYRLTPMPIIHNNDMYKYSGLSKIIGIEPREQRIVTWKEEIDIKQCLFSRLVLCQKLPISMSLAKSSCLSQLLDNARPNTNKCKVLRSRSIEQDFMQIDDRLWLLFNIHRAEKCHIYSSSDDRIQSVSINEPVLVGMPCNKSVICMGSQIPTASCVLRRTLVTSYFPLYSESQADIFLPIRNMTRTIISSYQSQFGIVASELMATLSTKRLNFKQLFENFLTYTVSAVTIVLIIVLTYLVKFIKYKLQKDIEYIQLTVETILDL